MINLRKISLLLVMLSLAVFAGCAGESSSSSIGNNAGSSSDTSYTISFNGSGAESGNIEEIKAKNNQQIQLPDNTFIKNGYKFTGWSETENGTVKYTNKAYITVKGNLELYAVWEKEESIVIEKYTVTFDGSGAESDSISPVKAEKGQSIILPANKFVKKGFIFAGWSDSPTGKVIYEDNAEVVVNENITLYAVWQKESIVIDKYTVTFDGSGAESGSISPVEAEKGQSIILPANKFVKKGFIFAGWSDSPLGEVIYEENAEIFVNNDITFYAVWQQEEIVEQTYTVTLYANDNTEKNTVYNFNKGDRFPLPFSPFTYSGYNFAGWLETKNGTAAYKDQDTITVDSNIILYAVWEKQDESKEQFKVIYDANNGSGEQRTYTAYKGAEYSLIFNTFTKEGYVFLGWSENPNAYEAAYYDGEIIAVSKDITLYAVWALEDDAYTVTFDINGGNIYFKDPAQLSARKGSYIILPLLSNYKHATLVPKGYTEKPDDAVYLIEGSKYYPKSDTTLYLLWSDGSHKELANTNQWIYGIDIQDSDWQNVNGKNIVMWEEGKSKWYDVFQGQTFMCWAASSNNMLLWWYNLNKTYVDRYMEEKGYSGPAFSYDGQGGGAIFDYYKTKWFDDGNSPAAALKWFLQGSSLRVGGGFFPDVFKNKDYTLTYTTISKGHINNLLTDIIQNKKIAAIQITTDGAHVVTFWGAGYDDNGFINKIYITDSALDNTLYNG